MKTPKLSQHTEATVFTLLETASNLVQRFDRALSVRGISFSEYRLLKTLSNYAGNGCPRVNLADAVGLSPSAVTRALKPLEKLGYVSSCRNERDARQSLAIMSPAGQQLLEDAQVVLDELLATLPLNTLNQKKVEEFQTRLNDLQ